MFHLLGDFPELSLTSGGEIGSWLFSLARRGVPVADTIVGPAELFASFREHGAVVPAVVNCLLGLTAAGDFASNPRCFLRSSTARPYSGLIADLQADKNPTALKHALERIYRSWSSDRARAARITRQVNDTAGMPAILVQPCYDSVETLVTRVPTTGELTDQQNAFVSPSNTVAFFLPEHADLLARIDTLSRRPCKVLLPAGLPPRILAVKEQLTTPAAALACASQYFRAGLIDRAEFLMRVEPSAYLDVGAMTVSAVDAFSARGLAASGLIATGRLYLFADDVVRAVKQHPGEGAILVRTEVSPEDIPGIAAASGVLTTRGSVTSHAALTCRRMGKVCVVGCEALELDYSTRKVIFPSGQEMHERSYVLLNGQTGDVYFSDHALGLESTLRVREETRGTLDALFEVLAAYDIPETFRTLPADLQARVGLHNKYLRESGLKR